MNGPIDKTNRTTNNKIVSRAISVSVHSYSFWRYFFLLFLIVVAFVYALPNIFGDDPAIQITSRDLATLPTDIQETIETRLRSAHLQYHSINQEHDAYLIRFLNEEDQFKAQNTLQTMGNNYSVALTLAPKTPKWLLALGARPMRLGLDLRGGVHFLLQVNVDDMVSAREQSDMRNMGEQLRRKNIRYAALVSNPRQHVNGFNIGFRDATTRLSALRYLQSEFPDYIFVSSQYLGEPALTVAMSGEALLSLRKYAVQQNLAILRARVRAMDIDEAIIQQQGMDQISVDLPGIQDMASAKNLIGKMVTIRLQLEDTEHDAANASSAQVVPFGSALYKDEYGRPVLLKNQAILTGQSIIGATADVDQNGRPAVSIRVGGSAVSSFNRITGSNVGKPLAVVYSENQVQKTIVNGKVLSTNVDIEKVINIATINSSLGNSFQITGLSSNEYASNLALLLRSGAYSAQMAYVEERVIGPSLGKQNIAMGIHSLEIGSALVVLFMIFYYRLFGIVADLALLLNIVFIVAVLSVIHGTLTMPGIAAIVLTVGMAVDANVLINERIREELRNGVSPLSSISAGYSRAFSTIIDANVTTLIIAIILLTVPSNTVQNFATTLIIGLLTSMMTAIFFTHAAVNLIYGGRRIIKSLSIGMKG